MAEAQWTETTIEAKNISVSVKNASLKWGKFYKNKPSEELQPSEINSIVIEATNTAQVNSSGASDAAAGTEGSFDLYDGPTRIGNYSWDCPWGSKTNRSTWTPSSSDTPYVVQTTGAHLDGGALGRVNIAVAKF